MFRNDDNTTSATLPALPTDNIGTPGYFTGGNPAASPPVPPTRVRFWWLNMIQEELAAIVQAGGIALDKTNNAQLLASVKALRGITIIQQIFTSSGTLALPANCFAVQIEGLAGGGGGGGAYGQPAYNVSAGTGGASGAYFKKTYTAAQCGTAAVMAIGAAGLGGAAGQNNGSAGGNTSFLPSGSGAACLAIGGGGGQFGITATAIQRGGFLAGSFNASGGDINVSGKPGSWPLLFGGSAAYQSISGSGGDSVYWPGGQSSQEAADGNIAKGYGAGGGGGAALTTSTAGAQGYQGCIIVTFFCFNL